MRAASVENYPLYIGLARILEMTSVTVPKAEGWSADMREKLAATKQLFEEGYDFVHVHSKGPDVSAHRKDPAEKVRTLEEIDSALAPVMEQVEQNRGLLVVITGDHATPSSGPLIHSGESVPILIAGGPNVLRDEVREFHERAAVHGGLGRIRGKELMPILLNLTDRVRLYGVRHSPRELPYWAREVKPFRIPYGD
jgi:2,3-bisphosphoglycerate-independent phosphoglycerate mutase